MGGKLGLITEMSPISVKVPMLMLVCSSIIFVMTTLVICTDHWVRIVIKSEEEFVGLFYSDKDSPLLLNCNTNTSETSCTYLTASRYAGVLAGLASLLTVYGYYMLATNFTSYSVPGLFWLMLGYHGLVQSILTMLCVLFYRLFASSYLTQNDDMNVEYAANDAITTTEFEWSFWALFSMAIFCFLLTSFNFSIENKWFRQNVLGASQHKGTTLKFNIIHNGV